MGDTYKIKVIKADTGEVVKTLEAATERAADRAERGLSINLNHADYYIVIEPPKDSQMTATEHLQLLQDDIKAASWRIAKKPMHDSIDRCEWYAWLSKRPSDWPDCECNEKPPSMTMTPSVLEIHGSAHGSVTFALCGQMGGQWYDLKLYAVALDEAMQTAEKATRSLGAAWKAIAQLEKQT